VPWAGGNAAYEASSQAGEKIPVVARPRRNPRTGAGAIALFVPGIHWGVGHEHERGGVGLDNLSQEQKLSGSRHQLNAICRSRTPRSTLGCFRGRAHARLDHADVVIFVGSTCWRRGTLQRRIWRYSPLPASPFFRQRLCLGDCRPLDHQLFGPLTVRPIIARRELAPPGSTP
jgi:hypothetical protein